MKKLILICLLSISFNLFGQNTKETARAKAKQAIEMMDEGQVDESILLLKECEAMDPDEYIYPYEIAYALVLKKEYDAAINILKRLRKYKGINSQVYQMLGNCYSYSGNPKKAIKTYEQGLKIFPNAGNLHLEKGNVYLYQEKYDDAVKAYKQGLEVDPLFPSNYYRLAKVYLRSSDKLSGLIYGEMFMNLERTTERTREMSGLLYDTYRNSIVIEGDHMEINFCDIIIGVENLKSSGIELPLCAIYGKNFMLGMLEQTEVNLESISGMRENFLKNFFMEDYQKYPTPLFEFHKKLLDQNLFEAYNHYLLQMGANEEFGAWMENHDADYQRFTEWYTHEENIQEIIRLLYKA